MSPNQLADALRNCAAGLLPLEAGTGLLIANGTFLNRDDFTGRFIHHGTSCAIAMAAIDWDAATTALAAGRLACSGGERRILLLAASLANGTPVSLQDTITGLDNANVALLVTAIQHAAGISSIIPEGNACGPPREAVRRSSPSPGWPAPPRSSAP